METDPSTLRLAQPSLTGRHRDGGLAQRRVLLTASADVRLWLRDHFARGVFQSCELLEADSLERARFILQHDQCDVHVIDASTELGPDLEGLEWMASRFEPPVILLATSNPELVAKALEMGVQQWLPRDLVLHHPRILAAALMQATRFGDLRQRISSAEAALQESRRHIGRLVALLWQSAPVDTRTHWFSQRHVLERLQEETDRAQRHGNSLSIILGDVRPAPAIAQGGDRVTLSRWVSQRLLQTKRRSDVAGQYGPDGFMVLLVQTAEAGAVNCCRRFRAVLEDPTAPGPAPLQAHFGIATNSAETSTSKALLCRAEERLEQALAVGR